MNKDLCRIGSNLSFDKWARWGGAGLLGLLILTLLTRCNSIENDIQQRTQQGLSSEGMMWAKTDLDGHGRDVLLTGEAPNEASKANAIKLVESTDGVRTVSHDISIKQYVSSTFSLKQADNQIVLSGTLPDQTSIDSTVSKAREIYGNDRVVSELVASDSASSPKWLAGAVGVMAAMKAAEDFSLDASDEKLNIGGIVETEEAKTLLLEQANTNFSTDITEAIQVVAKGPTPEELAADAAVLAELERLATEKRLAEEAEALLLAKQQQLAEEERVADLIEARRLAEEERLAEEAAELLLAKQQQLAEVERLAEEKRLADEAEALRLAEQKRLAVEARAVKARQAKLEADRLAEEKKLAAAQYQRDLLMSCQVGMNHLVKDHDVLFFDNSSAVKGSSYPVLAMLALKINACSDVLHQTNQYIDIQATNVDNEISTAHLSSVVSYLENINGAHRGLLRINESKLDALNGTSTLYFTISK